MTNKEILKQICLEEELENISFNENSFTIYFGDVLNTETSTGNTYYLLDTYVEIPYDFISRNVKLHRGIINEYETSLQPYYNYSGFVHYSGDYFCYGQSGVDFTCNVIREEGLDSDKLHLLLLKIKHFLSISSHDSGGRVDMYKKLDIGNVLDTKSYLIDHVVINDVIYPKTIRRDIINKSVSKVDYSKPYEKVIIEKYDRKFIYQGVEIIPKVVRHHYEETVKITQDYEYLNIADLNTHIKNYTLNKIQNEIDNSKKYNLEDFLHKLSNKHSRVDGSVYI